MGKWLSDNIVAIVGIVVVVVIALAGWLFGLSNNVVRHDERIATLKADAIKREQLQQEFRRDMSSIKEDVAQMRYFLERKVYIYPKKKESDQ